MTKKNNYAQPRERETWAIRGIEPETRNAVRIAARKSGESIGEWCNRVLYEAAAGVLREGTSSVPAPRLEETLAELVKQMQRQSEEARAEREAMAARLAGIEDRQHQAQKKPVEGRLSRAWGILRGKP